MQRVTNKLQVRHYAQVPCKPFCVDVASEEEAYKIMTVLTEQHLFLYENRIIPDYSNAIEIVMWDDDSDGEGNPGWTSYWNDKEEMEWDDLELAYLKNN